jgi:plasmid stabilization system protein ParE
MLHQVVFSPQALAQLEALYGYVAQAASPDIASRSLNLVAHECLPSP